MFAKILFDGFFFVFFGDLLQKQQRDEDSDVDEDDCALSENWTFQPELRRWSRLTEIIPLSLNLPSNFNNKMDKQSKSSSNPRESSPEE